MDIRELQRNWEMLGRIDPMWAILTEPDKLGGRWDEGEFFAGGRALVAAIVEQLRPFGLPRQQNLALDFGCGLGRLTQAAHNTRPDLSFVASDTVDFVLSLLVLQHMRSELAQGYVAEFLRVLRPGGVAVFQAPYAGPDCWSGPAPGGTIMEMNVTPKERVRALVDAASARLVLCHDDDGGGAGWPSCVYVVTRD